MAFDLRKFNFAVVELGVASSLQLPIHLAKRKMTTCNNCRFDGNAKDASFCSRCGAPLNGAYQAPQPGVYPAQAFPNQPPPQVAQAVPVQQPQYVVMQTQPQVVAGGEFIVVPGQILTASGHCAHVVQTNEFTCPGIVLGILFFPIGILCCLLLTERRCVHCGAVLN
ncbi:hypothetical protein AeMF1_001440 [Aphanomyces euteiches]|nr:hypothetical protein AeMF1_001440 [Aphanomyces euteiches]